MEATHARLGMTWDRAEPLRGGVLLLLKETDEWAAPLTGGDRRGEEGRAMRARKGSRVRHAEDGRAGTILRFYDQWDAGTRRWEPVAVVAWDDDGTDSPWPLRDLVPVRRARKGK